MDVLADAAAMREDSAAEILNLMCAQQGHSRSQSDSEDDGEAAPPELETDLSTDEPGSPSWAPEEDDLLRRLVCKALARAGTSRGRGATTARSAPLDPDTPFWENIAMQFDGREPAQCLHRWQKALNAENIKGGPLSLP